MRTHSFYNVGHGDAVIIEDNDYIVVRDIGQHSKRRKFYRDSMNLALYDIVISDKKKYAIISHAHKDHFSGFRELFNQSKYHLFDESFIPPLVLPNGAFFSNSSSKRLSEETINQLKSKIKRYLKVYSSLKRSSSTKKLISNWFFLLPIMNFLSKKVSMVSCGDLIINQNATVLWPPLAQSLKDRKQIAIDDFNIRNTINIHNIEIRLLFEEPDFPNDSLEQLNQLSERILAVYTQILEKNNDTINEENEQSKYEEKKDFVHEIDNVLNEIDRTSIYSLSKHIKNALCTAIKNDDDNMSLIFQYNDASAIYLSDIDKKNIPHLVNVMQQNGLILPQYNLLKSSHHGSRYEGSLKSIKYNCVVHTCGIGISSGPKAHNGPYIGYAVGKRNTYCMDWNHFAMNLNPIRWDPFVFNTSTICTPFYSIGFII